MKFKVFINYIKEDDDLYIGARATVVVLPLERGVYSNFLLYKVEKENTDIKITKIVGNISGPINNILKSNLEKEFRALYIAQFDSKQYIEIYEI